MTDSFYWVLHNKSSAYFSNVEKGTTDRDGGPLSLRESKDCRYNTENMNVRKRIRVKYHHLNNLGLIPVMLGGGGKLFFCCFFFGKIPLSPFSTA